MNSLARGLRRVCGARQPPVANSVTAASVGISTGGTSYPAGEAAAMKLSAVSRCIEVLSDSLSKMPSYCMNSTSRQRVDIPVLRLLTVRPNEAMTPSVRKKMLEANRLCGGNAYDWIVRDPVTLQPRELIPVPYKLVTPWQDTDGRVWYTVTHPYTGAPMVLPNEDIIHYKAYSSDGLTGISVLKRAAEVIASGTAAQEYERSYFENGSYPSGVLTAEGDINGSTTLTLADGTEEKVSYKELIRREWEKIHAGPSNSHRIAVLDFGVKYQPISMSNADAQFVESRELTVQDIARFFGVPLYKLQAGNQSYNANEYNAVEYVVGTLHPIVTQYEEEQTYKLLTDSQISSGLELRMNMMAELRGDFASRGSWYEKMRNIGAYSANDIRAYEDLPDVEGGDEYYASLNYVPQSIWRRLSEQRNAGGR